jgi:hypothetical protein
MINFVLWELNPMPLQDKVVKYSVYVAHNDFVDFQRVIDLRLESGETSTIAFSANPPDDWLQFSGSHTTLYMAAGRVRGRIPPSQSIEPVAPNFLHHPELAWNSGGKSLYGT